MQVSPSASADTHLDSPGEHGPPFSWLRSSSSVDAVSEDPLARETVDVQPLVTMTRYAQLDPTEPPQLLVEATSPSGVVRDITVLHVVPSLTMSPSGELKRITLKEKIMRLQHLTTFRLW